MSGSDGIRAARAFVEVGADLSPLDRELNGIDRKIAERNSSLRQTRGTLKSAEAAEKAALKKVQENPSDFGTRRFRQEKLEEAAAARKVAQAQKEQLEAEVAGLRALRESVELRKQELAKVQAVAREERAAREAAKQAANEERRARAERVAQGAKNAAARREARFEGIDAERNAGRKGLGERLAAKKAAEAPGKAALDKQLTDEGRRAADIRRLSQELDQANASEYQKKLDRARAYYTELRTLAHGNARMLAQVAAAEAVELDSIMLAQNAIGGNGGPGGAKGAMRSAVAYIGRAGKRVANIGGGAAPLIAGAVGAKIGITAAEYITDRQVASIQASKGALDSNVAVTEKWLEKMEAIPLVGAGIQQMLVGVHDANKRILDLFGRNRTAGEVAFKGRTERRIAIEDQEPVGYTTARKRERARIYAKEYGTSGVDDPETLSRQLKDADAVIAKVQAEQAEWDRKADIYRRSAAANGNPAAGEANISQFLGTRPDLTEPTRIKLSVQNKYDDMEEYFAAFDRETARIRTYGQDFAGSDTEEARIRSRSARSEAEYEGIRHKQSQELHDARTAATLRTGPADLTSILDRQERQRAPLEARRHTLMREALYTRQGQEITEAEFTKSETIPELKKKHLEEEKALEAEITRELEQQQAANQSLINQERMQIVEAERRVKLLKEQMQARTVAAKTDDKYEREWGEIKKQLETDPRVTQQQIGEVKKEWEASVVAQKEQDRRAMTEDLQARREAAATQDPIAKEWIGLRRKMKSDGQSDSDIEAMRQEHRQTANMEFAAEQVQSLPRERYLQHMRQLDEARQYLSDPEYAKLKHHAAGMLPAPNVQTSIGQSVFSGAASKTDEALDAMIKSERHLAGIVANGYGMMGS